MKLRIQERFKDDFAFGWGRHSTTAYDVKWKLLIVPTISLERWRNGWCLEAAWGLWAIWVEFEHGAQS